MNNPPYFSGGLLGTYGYLSRAFCTALRSLGIDVQVKNRKEQGRVLRGSALCFQSTSYGELSVNRRKVIGSAQKRWKGGFLQQGSIQLTVDPGFMEKVFRNTDYEKISSSMTGIRDLFPALSVDELKKSILNAFEEVFQIGLIPMAPAQEEEALALRLEREKYQAPEWTFSR